MSVPLSLADAIRVPVDDRAMQESVDECAGMIVDEGGDGDVRGISRICI